MKTKSNAKGRRRRREPWESKTLEAMKRASPKRRVFAAGLGTHAVPARTRLNVWVVAPVDFRVERMVVPHQHSMVEVSQVTVAGTNILRAFSPVPAIVFVPEVALNFLWVRPRESKNVAKRGARICVSVENTTEKSQTFTGALIGPEL